MGLRVREGFDRERDTWLLSGRCIVAQPGRLEPALGTRPLVPALRMARVSPGRALGKAHPLNPDLQHLVLAVNARTISGRRCERNRTTHRTDPFQKEPTGTAAARKIPDIHGYQIVVHLKAKKSQHDAEETIFFRLDLRRCGYFAFPADFPPSGCGGGA